MHCLLHSNFCTRDAVLDYLILINIPAFNIGNVYIVDTNNNRIRKVTVSTGIVTLIAGTGTASNSGDNGAATSAALNYPRGVALDASGRTLLSLSVALFYYTVICALRDAVLDYS